jgi:hypothetical protein
MSGWQYRPWDPRCFYSSETLFPVLAETTGTWQRSIIRALFLYTSVGIRRTVAETMLTNARNAVHSLGNQLRSRTDFGGEVARCEQRALMLAPASVLAGFRGVCSGTLVYVALLTLNKHDKQPSICDPKWPGFHHNIQTRCRQ